MSATNQVRLTIYKLIDHLVDRYGQISKQEEPEDAFEIAQDVKVNQIEELKFNLLPVGQSQSIGDFPESLKEIFDPYIKNMYRHGSIMYLKDPSVNLSLFSSVLTCLLDGFRKLPQEEKEIYIKNMRDKLCIDLNTTNLFTEFEYKTFNWKVKDLKEYLKLYKNNRMVIRFLADYYKLNIFLLNITEDKIYAIYREENYNMYKPAILLSFFSDTFEPITYHDTYLWNYDTDPLRKLINVDRQKINLFDVDFSGNKNKIIPVFQPMSEDLTKYLHQDKQDEQDKQEEQDKPEPQNNFMEEVDELQDQDSKHLSSGIFLKAQNLKI